MNKRKKKHPWLKFFGFVVLFFILVSGGLAYYVYHSLTSTVATMHTPINREISEKRAEPVSLQKQQPFSVLLLGVDEREGDRGRSDTMIVMAVNPNLNTTKLLSIPRDTRTDIIGKGTVDKINHAWAFGGPEMSMDTVEHFLDIPIDYYVKVNMESFKDIVDAVGGVTVENSSAFTTGNQSFPAGTLTLNGKEALSYSRERYSDPNGDFGRQERQRQIIQAVLQKGASISSVTNFSDILSALSKNIQTNLEFDQMVDIQANYRSATKSIVQSTIKETGEKINGVYYGIVDNTELQNVQNELKSHLEIK